MQAAQGVATVTQLLPAMVLQMLVIMLLEVTGRPSVRSQMAIPFMLTLEDRAQFILSQKDWAVSTL